LLDDITEDEYDKMTPAVRKELEAHARYAAAVRYLAALLKLWCRYLNELITKIDWPESADETLSLVWKAAKADGKECLHDLRARTREIAVSVYFQVGQARYPQLPSLVLKQSAPSHNV
jgi:hypothetical protein